MIACFKMAFSTVSQCITGISSLKSLQISLSLLNNLKDQIMVSNL